MNLRKVFKNKIKLKLLKKKLGPLGLENSITEIKKKNSTSKCLLGKNQFTFNKILKLLFMLFRLLSIFTSCICYLLNIYNVDFILLLTINDVKTDIVQ